MTSIADVGRESAEDAQTGGQTQDDFDYERFDVSDVAWTKAFPTTAVGGTPIALRYLYDPDDPDRGDVGLVLDDPFVDAEDDITGGTIILRNDDESGDDYRVYNTDDEATKLLTGAGPVEADEVDDMDEVTGVDFDSNSFYGDVVEDFGDERIVLKLTGSAGRSASRCLDVCGQPNARPVRNDDGVVQLTEEGLIELTHGLIEKHPDNYDDETDDWTPPRFARDPQLRPDVEGETVAVLLQRGKDVLDDYDGNAYWATVMVDGEDGWESIEPTAEFTPDEDLIGATEYIEWNWPSDEELETARDAEDAIEA